MPIQLRRLLLLLIVLLIIFIVIRQLLVPESFGQYGHFRGESLEENAAFPAKYVDEENCFMCHDDIAVLKNAGNHEILHCQICHGPGFMHIDDPGTDSTRMIIPEGRDYCAACHDKNNARIKYKIVQIDANEHNTEMNCTECHNPHDL